MRCLVIGAGGQLGRALQATVPAKTDLVAPARLACDLTNADHINRWLGEIRPDVVFNAAAYTAVDAAESDETNARLTNAISAGRLAQAAGRYGATACACLDGFCF